MGIGIVGVGQMGRNYLRILIEDLGIHPEQIVLCDTDPERLMQALLVSGALVGAKSTEDLASKVDAAIVATNTPSHYSVIRCLAENGVRRILVEKPITQNAQELQKIRDLELKCDGLQISTALVIGFSPVRKILVDLIKNENLVLRDATGSWGENRGYDGEKHPTAGDRVDEFAHMLEFLLGLVRVHGIHHVNVVSQIGYLRYVNDEAQNRMHDIDSSYPLLPDHSTKALLTAVLKKGGGLKEDGASLDMALASSFLEAEQVRIVRGTLVRIGTDFPAYSFTAYFDEKTEVNGVMQTVDRLVLTEVRTNEVRQFVEPCDKLGSLTRAFVEWVQGGERNELLADVEWAGYFVRLMEEIGESDRRRRGGMPGLIQVTF
jgi:predicted dehydrogenase